MVNRRPQLWQSQGPSHDGEAKVRNGRKPSEDKEVLTLEVCECGAEGEVKGNQKGRFGESGQAAPPARAAG